MQIVSNHNYYDRAEVSNSMLSAYAKYKRGESYAYPEAVKAAFRFGALVDWHLTGGVEDCPVGFTDAELALCDEMIETAHNDRLFSAILRNSDKQVAAVGELLLPDGILVQARCLADYYLPSSGVLADLKTTAAGTEGTWMKSFTSLGYARQAAWYMDIFGLDTFIFLALSKKGGGKMFTTVVERGCTIYKQGLADYRRIAGEMAADVEYLETLGISANC